MKDSKAMEGVKGLTRRIVSITMAWAVVAAVSWTSGIAGVGTVLAVGQQSPPIQANLSQATTQSVGGVVAQPTTPPVECDTPVIIRKSNPNSVLKVSWTFVMNFRKLEKDRSGRLHPIACLLFSLTGKPAPVFWITQPCTVKGDITFAQDRAHFNQHSNRLNSYIECDNVNVIGAIAHFEAERSKASDGPDPFAGITFTNVYTDNDFTIAGFGSLSLHNTTTAINYAQGDGPLVYYHPTGVGTSDKYDTGMFVPLLDRQHAAVEGFINSRFYPAASHTAGFDTATPPDQVWLVEYHRDAFPRAPETFRCQWLCYWQVAITRSNNDISRLGKQTGAADSLVGSDGVPLWFSGGTFYIGGLPTSKLGFQGTLEEVLFGPGGGSGRVK